MGLAKQIRPSFLKAKNIPRCMCTRITTCPSLSFRVVMSKQEVRQEVLLNIRYIVKGYHLCRFEVNVGEVFTTSKKRGEPSWTAQPPTVRVCGSSLATTYANATQNCDGGSEQTTESSRNGPSLTTMMKKKYIRLFHRLLHILFLLDTIDAFINLLVCMYVIFVLSTISFGIIRLGIAALFIILPFFHFVYSLFILLAISFFANVELLLPEFFCEGTMQPLSV